MDKLEKLPDGITQEMMDSIRDAAGVQAMSLGFDVDLEIKSEVRTHASKRGYPTVLLRIILTMIGIKFWLSSEQALWDLIASHGKGEPLAIKLSDYGHELFKPLKNFLVETENIEPACYLSQFLDEFIVLVMMYKSVTGKTFRPLMALIFGLSIRLICRMFT